MLVSWNWLNDYVKLDMELSELENRLSMSGLNHEESRPAEDDVTVDLEVTSNRADCLGHMGVAREIAVLWKKPLSVPDPQPPSSGKSVRDEVKVRIDCPELCPRYTARLVRGVKVGPSPDWLVNRLAAVNVAPVNNIVDITNYVLMECGQPLHAFDFAKLAGPQIIVREAAPGEKFEAIDHRTYELTGGMCVIADAERPVALAGVMGGADSEISASTTDVLIEAADFAQLSVRTTARHLSLHSPSSYRFERGVDPEGIDWASRRCCELILEIAGGTLAPDLVDAVGQETPTRPAITLRLAQIPRVLGIEIPQLEVERILTALGNEVVSQTSDSVIVNPPSWRRDLVREIDLIEELARIYGYEQIPEDARVPMVPSHRDDRDRVQHVVRRVLTGLGFDEAMTTSVVSEAWTQSFSPWTQAPAIRAITPMLRGADRLRCSLIPSLLGARQLNESQSNPVIELFEMAKVYLPRPGGLPDERWMLGLTSGRDFFAVKGALQTILRTLNPAARWETRDFVGGFLDPSQACQLMIGGAVVGALGRVSAEGAKRFGLRGDTTVAELAVGSLEQVAVLIPQYVEQSAYPAINRDLNMIVDEPVRWSQLASTVRAAAGDIVEDVTYRETFRDAQRDGAGKKRLMFSMMLRAGDRTLTGDEADQACQKIIEACQKEHGATLVQ